MLFDWQKLVIIGILGLDEEDKFVSTDDGINVARQNGKGVILQAIEGFAAFELGYETVMHTAHEFSTALDHQMRLESFVQNSPDLHAQVKDHGYRHAAGREALILRSGCRIVFKARTKGGGRGFSGDLLVWDEAMVISDAVVGAQKPMIRASRAPHGHKTIFAGSAVDKQVHEHGATFTRMRRRGLSEDPRVSYFEWSAPFDDPADVTVDTLKDMSVARAANPSMDDGLISEETVHDELLGMPVRQAAVELYGIGDYPPIDASATGLFDIGRWNLLGGNVDLDEGATLSLDVSPLRTWGSICGAKISGDRVEIGVIHREEGTGWLVPRIVELQEEIAPARIVCDERGPAASLLSELEAAGIEVELIGTVDYTRACGLFFDAYDQGKLVHDGNIALESAIRGAAQRSLADAWAWSRKHSRADITPLVAATVAHWSEATAKSDRKFVAVGFA